MRVIQTLKQRAEWPEELYPANEELRAAFDRDRCSDFFLVITAPNNTTSWGWCEGNNRDLHLHYDRHHMEPFCAFCGKAWFA